MKATISKTFSDADFGERCENCDDQLEGAAQLWTIDKNVSRGWFCSKRCADHSILLAGIDNLDATEEEKEALRGIDHVEGLEATDAKEALSWFRDCHDRHTFKVGHCAECYPDALMKRGRKRKHSKED